MLDTPEGLKVESRDGAHFTIPLNNNPTLQVLYHFPIDWLAQQPLICCHGGQIC
jgi:hypothetical protein